MLLMIQNYGTTPMTQIIQNKSTNSQIHKYTKISTNTTKYLIKCSSKHNVREIAPWHYPHVPGNPPKIHKFTNPICTNPQIHKSYLHKSTNTPKWAQIYWNMHKYTQSRGDGPMLLMTQNYGTTPMTQKSKKKSINSQIWFVQIHKYTQIHINTREEIHSAYDEKLLY